MRVLLLAERLAGPSLPRQIAARELWDDGDVRWLAGVNQSQGRTYVHKEQTEELLWWLQLPRTMEPTLEAEDLAETMQRVEAEALDAAGVVATAGYDVARFSTRAPEPSTERPETEDSGARGTSVSAAEGRGKVAAQSPVAKRGKAVPAGAKTNSSSAAAKARPGVHPASGERAGNSSKPAAKPAAAKSVSAKRASAASPATKQAAQAEAKSGTGSAEAKALQNGTATRQEAPASRGSEDTKRAPKGAKSTADKRSLASPGAKTGRKTPAS